MYLVGAFGLVHDEQQHKKTNGLRVTCAFTIVNFCCLTIDFHYAKTGIVELIILLLMLKPSHVVVCEMLYAL
jgi:hypothetical protein